MSRPLLLALLAIALLSVMDAVIKALAERVPVIEIAFIRYCVGSAAMAAVCAVRRPGWPSPEALRANAARTVLVVITAVAFFYALSVLPLAETLVLSFVSPVFTAALAPLVLGERLGSRIALALAAGFAGVVLVAGAGPFGSGAASRSGPLLGVAAVILSAAGYAASCVLLRARALQDPAVTIVAIQNVVAVLILVGPAAWVWTAPSAADWVLLAIVGLLGVTGHLCFARAYAGAEAMRLAVLEYTALIWAVVIGWAAFGEIPTAATLVGGALIVGATLIAGRR